MANDITTEDQEMGGAKKLSKSAIRRAYWDWMFYNLSVQNFERMQGPAIIKMLADVREDLYPGDPEAQQEMLERHEVFFNTWAASSPASSSAWRQARQRATTRFPPSS